MDFQFVKFAMSNALTITQNLNDPEVSRIGEWLIVERFPNEGMIWVSDSDTFVLSQQPDRPADDIAERNSLIGRLTEQDAESELYTLLLSTNVDQQQPPGQFFPSLGFIRLSMATDGIHLAGAGSTGGGGVVWHFDAMYAPWSNEIAA